MAIMSTKGPSITNFLLHMTILMGLIMVPCKMDIMTILLLWKMCRTGMLALHMPLHMPAASITALSVVVKQSPLHLTTQSILARPVLPAITDRIVQTITNVLLLGILVLPLGPS